MVEKGENAGNDEFISFLKMFSKALSDYELICTDSDVDFFFFFKGQIIVGK